ncbi:hypothetical protein LSTR_LSTR007958 [Laodelphax striatellus]|uniref:Uncharacterized protein n=1 Tax=Laodelphax striatellus TaxID=195883 RepID=A0A482XF34_LAOST|nr:hypothetical protein LSTR_LSTR007958 [Laodelphax striatellus]
MVLIDGWLQRRCCLAPHCHANAATPKPTPISASKPPASCHGLTTIIPVVMQTALVTIPVNADADDPIPQSGAHPPPRSSPSLGVSLSDSSSHIIHWSGHGLAFPLCVFLGSIESWTDRLCGNVVREISLPHSESRSGFGTLRTLFNSDSDRVLLLLSTDVYDLLPPTLVRGVEAE